MQSNFADSIANIAVTGPLIRIDYGVATPTHTPEGKQELHMTPTQQVVMPLEGFVRAFALQEQIFKKLITDGVIKIQPPQATFDPSRTLVPAQ
jgi:hypothetical protein